MDLIYDIYEEEVTEFTPEINLKFTLEEEPEKKLYDEGVETTKEMVELLEEKLSKTKVDLRLLLNRRLGWISDTIEEWASWILSWFAGRLAKIAGWLAEQLKIIGGSALVVTNTIAQYIIESVNKMLSPFFVGLGISLLL